MTDPITGDAARTRRLREQPQQFAERIVRELCTEAALTDGHLTLAIEIIRYRVAERDVAVLDTEGDRPIMVDRDADLRIEMRVYLDTLRITGRNIGDIRRSLFVPWDSLWNGWVRDETAARELRGDTEGDQQAQKTWCQMCGTVCDVYCDACHEILFHADTEGDQPTPPQERTLMDSGLCCLKRHANAIPPWTCDCLCHTLPDPPVRP